MKKKLLIAGGGYADIPLIKAAKSLGFYVVTSGNRADDLGHCHSDECRLEDFSDPEAMLRLAQELNVDAVCACCNDFSALTAAYVAEKMGLPGHDNYSIAQVIHHKDLYRDFALKHNIPAPRAQGFVDADQALSALTNFRFPVIVKPVDLTGGKGITTISRLEDAQSAIDGAFGRSKAKRIVIEEFIEGSRHGFSAFVLDGRIVFYFNDNEHYYLNPYLVSAASSPAQVPPGTAERLVAVSEKIVALLNLVTGIFHIQYIMRDDEPVIIEICRRAPGDLYVQFVQHATGVDYPAYIVRAAAGMDCGDLTQILPTGYFTRHCIMTSRPGQVRGLSIDPMVQANIIDQFTWWKVGDQVEDFLTQKFGIVFLQFSSVPEMLQKTQNMQCLIKMELA